MPVSASTIAAVLRERLPGLAVQKLHKLLYYCQGHHLATFDEPLFSEALEAWDRGPVVPALWRAEKHGADPQPSEKLGEAELNTIGYVLSRYGALTGQDLEILNHGEDPWLIANQGRAQGGSAVIEHGWIARYFRTNSSTEGEGRGDTLDRAAVSAWLRDTASRPGEPSEPGHPLSREELRERFAAIEAGLGG
ncbi:MAG TPA: type II toxin-antitoxin system antitoxin SocA domain-containing protein [Pseudonocardiaceae bacterium]|jgi:uncharacterized phage-associated protein|nr:type II toxin-antitoxin system antitoxin SocA domain-containing protein [Pseudonocardiaceae bacterium]